MIRIAIFVCCSTGCMALDAKAKPTTTASIAAGAAGAAITGAALAGAFAADDSTNVKQCAGVTAASVVPIGALYLGEEPEEPTTPGGIYRNLLGGLGSSFGMALLFTVPLIGAAASGDARDEDNALYGAAGGMFVGTVTSVLLGKHLPKWGRVVVGALVTGSMTTLGYQLAR